MCFCATFPHSLCLAFFLRLFASFNLSSLFSISVLMALARLFLSPGGIIIASTLFFSSDENFGMFVHINGFP